MRTYMCAYHQVEKRQSTTKNCPKCKTPWWKNGGCNHFSCSCGHEFCWVCLRPWIYHGGGFYVCEKGEDTKEKKQMEVEVVVGEEVSTKGKGPA